MCQVTAASERTEPIKSVLMEEVVRRENLKKALKRVCTNKGSPIIVFRVSPNLLRCYELDKELERRGHKFCRYADDCNI